MTDPSTPSSGTTDVFGVAPYGRSLEIATTQTLQGIGRFLQAICMPAAEEFGLLLKDNVRHWRAMNAIKMLVKSKKIADENHFSGQVHPWIFKEIFESSSWQDDDLVNNMWSGLLASSINDGKPGTDLLYVDILKSLTPTQCRIVKYAVDHCTIATNQHHLMLCCPMFINLEQLPNIVGYDDYHRMDLELDDLKRKELIQQALDVDTLFANIGPTPIALQLYARCQGNKEPLLRYYIDKIAPGISLAQLPDLRSKAYDRCVEFRNAQEKEKMSRQAAQSTPQNTGTHP